MGLVDTHCHLQSQRFDVDRETVRKDCLDALDWIVVIGDDLPSSEAALELVGDGVHAVVGVHPYYAKDFDDATLDRVRDLAGSTGVIGLGEMGLDYFNEYSPRDAQADAFRSQLELACELNLPVVIHNRDADEDCYEILRAYSDRLAGCIMHCFGSGPAYAEKFLDLGFYISFAGNVTFKKAVTLQEAAQVVPLDRLLVETDAPYLAPVPKRGKRCEPHFVAHTAAFLAELKGIPLPELESQTTANAHTVYAIPSPTECPAP
jgi:TatD DNase family protein